MAAEHAEHQQLLNGQFKLIKIVGLIVVVLVRQSPPSRPAIAGPKIIVGTMRYNAPNAADTKVARTPAMSPKANPRDGPSKTPNNGAIQIVSEIELVTPVAAMKPLSGIITETA